MFKIFLFFYPPSKTWKTESIKMSTEALCNFDTYPSPFHRHLVKPLVTNAGLLIARIFSLCNDFCNGYSAPQRPAGQPNFLIAFYEIFLEKSLQQSINQSIDRSIKESINQSTSRSINQWMVLSNVILARYISNKITCFSTRMNHFSIAA